MTQLHSYEKVDVVGFIVKVEEGGFDPDDDLDVKCLQYMINSGLIWKLQGWWHRFAKHMIGLGIVSIPESIASCAH